MVGGEGSEDRKRGRKREEEGLLEGNDVWLGRTRGGKDVGRDDWGGKMLGKGRIRGGTTGMGKDEGRNDWDEGRIEYGWEG